MKMRQFLWNGNDEERAKAKVDWEHVCRPKNEGGLGFIDLVIWNKAAQLKHLWFFSTNVEDSLGPSWVRSELIKNKNFWTMRVPSTVSWSFRKIFLLRPLV